MFQKVSKYDQGLPQLHNTDQPTASRGRVTEHSSIPRVKEIVCRIEVTGWNCSHNNHRVTITVMVDAQIGQVIVGLTIMTISA